MKNAILSLILLSFSCATSAPRAQWPKPNQNEILRYCWEPGAEQPSGWADEHGSCSSGESWFLQWEGAPVKVTSVSEMEIMTRAAVEEWNFMVGFELFTYKAEDLDAQVILLPGGPHQYWLGVARHFKDENGDLFGGIFIFDGGMESLSTYVHELGHIVGLAHDPDNIHSIMYPSSARVLPSLEKKDRDLLRRRYLGRRPRKK